MLELILIGTEEETAAKLKYHSIDLLAINLCLQVGKVDKNVASFQFDHQKLKKRSKMEVYDLIHYLIDSRACFLYRRAVVFRLKQNSDVLTSTINGIGPNIELHFEVEVYLLDKIPY